MNKNWSDLSEGLCAVLNTGNAQDKAATVHKLHKLWCGGALDFTFSKSPPDRPNRPSKPELLDPTKMTKRRKGGSITNRQAIMHAVCHIELNAIDLAIDIVCRFGADMPRDFTDDWIKVADDEARHFLMIHERLTDLGSHYGAMPAHDGLWQSAQATANDLSARLAIVPMVLEARGLDVTPNMIDRFNRFDDKKSAAVLTVIYDDEISHVACGTKWFNHVAESQGLDPQKLFQQKVTEFFRGYIKPPFNKSARDAANFPQDWYLPLVDLC